jgi:hypothetical protein
MFLRVLELTGLALFIGFLVTQVAIPGLANLPLFPWFRGERKAQHRLADAQEQARIADTEKAADRAFKKADIRHTPPRVGD